VTMVASHTATMIAKTYHDHGRKNSTVTMVAKAYREHGRKNIL
jgi:hypothetical protein